MAERARLGEGRERLSEVGCVAPGGVGLSSGAEGRRVGRGKALDQRRWSSVSGFHAWYAACAVSAASKEISVHFLIWKSSILQFLKNISIFLGIFLGKIYHFPSKPRFYMNL